MALSDSTRDLYRLLQEKAKTPRWARTEQAGPHGDSAGRLLPGVRRRAGAPKAKKRWKIPPKVRQVLPYVVAFLAILAPLLHNPPRDNRVPQYLIGVWETTTPGYRDRYLMFAERNVAFGTGKYEGESYIVAETQVSSAEDGAETEAGKRMSFKIRYMKSDKLEYDLSFHYDPLPDPTITFKNQENLRWTRKKGPKS